jgi:ribosomal protein S4
MRSNNKYKIYNQADSLVESFHQRLLNFKRPKWGKIKKKILQRNRSRKFLVNNLRVKATFKNWDKVKTYYNFGLKNKNSVYSYFDNSIRIKHINETLKKNKSCRIQEKFLNCLIKPEYRIDILLARLGFFCSSFQARQSLFSKKVLVNGCFVRANFLLRKGDIITLLDSIKLNINQSFINLSPTKKIFSFIEIDYYNNTVVIIKNLNDLHLQDIYLLSVNHCDLKKIKDFL